MILVQFVGFFQANKTTAEACPDGGRPRELTVRVFSCQRSKRFRGVGGWAAKKDFRRKRRKVSFAPPLPYPPHSFGSRSIFRAGKNTDPSFAYGNDCCAGYVFSGEKKQEFQVAYLCDGKHKYQVTNVFLKSKIVTFAL